MDISWHYLAANYYQGLEMLAAVVAVLILLSSLDDLFFDAWYWLRRGYRRLTIERVRRPLTPAQLRERTAQPLAIMVPAWKEYDVIAAMIENMVKVLDYRQYVVFVGTYCNDEATIAEVERMRRRYKQLRRVEVPNPGPTCKADCLNWIVKAIFLHEKQHNMQFAGVILHDSEDVLHPLELQLFNYMLPRMDMVQLPVMSLEREWHELVAGTYMDEFAEWHGKDMQVRESMSNVVPSAGVGTCFSRRALMALSANSHDEPFNTRSLTEDYEVGAHLSRLGMKQIFAMFPVQFQVRRRAWFGLRPDRDLTVSMPLCVREYFPNTFKTAYRQRARWTLGIGLQSWETIAWRGSLAARYILLRDRKGIVTAFISILAYLLVVQLGLFLAAKHFGVWTVYYPSIFTNSTWFNTLITFNLGAMIWRAFSRAYFVNKLYGWEHAIMSVPRMVVGNFINFMAVARAWRMFMAYLFKGKAMAWDKTMHDFPSEDRLGQKHQKLGDLLTAWQAIDEEKLADALSTQAELSMPLGRVLVSKGWLDDETLAEAIAFQADLPRAQFNETTLQALSAKLPAALRTRWRTVCIGLTDTGQTVLAAANPLSAAVIEQLTEVLGQSPLVHIAREGEIAACLRLLAGITLGFDADQDLGVPLLGDLLIERAMVKREVVDRLMESYQPARHGRIGDYLADHGALSREAVEEAVREQQRLRQARKAQMASEQAELSPLELAA